MSKTHDASLADTLFPSSYTVISAAYSRNGDSVKLILSGDETLVLPAKEYALLNLKEESTLTREELVELKKSEALLMARKKALRLLDRRAYTGAQLKLKLSAAMYPKTVIRQVLQQLLEQGYLDG